MADDILKKIPLPADLPENWTSGQIIAPTGAEVGLDNQHGYNYLMKQVNNAQKAATALNAGKVDKSIVQDENGNVIFYSKTETDAKIKEMLDRQREEDYARIKFWASNDPTSPASFIGGTWERIEDCTIWGASNTHPAGTKLEAGLPNITGSAYGDTKFGGDAIYWRGSGAIQTAKDTKGINIVGYQVQGYGESRSILGINASKSNSIYGKSATVQPPAYCIYIWRRVA